MERIKRSPIFVTDITGSDLLSVEFGGGGHNSEKFEKMRYL